MKKVLIYSINYSPEKTGIGKYNGEMARFLSNQGFDVSVITAPPYYPEWKRHKGFRNTFSRSVDAGVSVYRSPCFVPEKVTTLKRFIHLLSFCLSSMVYLFKFLFNKQDVIFVVQPTLFCSFAALTYAKLTRAKSIMHIQDFEVDAFHSLSGGEGGKVVAFISKVESAIMNRYEVLSSISYQMMARALSKSSVHEKCFYFPNWSDVEFMSPGQDVSEIRKHFGIADGQKAVLYSGNIGEKQGLDIIVDLAAMYQQRQDVTFLIVGEGAYLGSLQDLVFSSGLTNIKLMPLQPWGQVPKMLCMATCHLVIQRLGVSEAVLPSKLTNILACGGNSVVSSESGSELASLADNFPGIFRVVEPENVVELKEAVDFYLDEESTINTVARSFALENLDVNKVIPRFIDEAF